MTETNVVAQAQLYLDLQRPHEALRILGAALATNPDDSATLRTLALAHLQADRGRPGGELAVRAATQAVTLSPHDAFAWRILALGYSRLGRHPDARKVARTARSLAPDFWASYTLIAEVDCNAKYITTDTHAAVAEALKLAPNEPSVLFSAARVAQIDGRLSEARTLYEHVLALRPSDASARNNLALISLKRGDTGKAAAGFAGVLAQNPNSELALRNLRATGFSALRIVYFILIICVVLMNNFVRGSNDYDSSNGHLSRVVVAVLAAACVGGYLLWFRRKAGTYFGRIVRSIPATDKLLFFWAIVLAGCLGAIVGAVFVSGPDAALIYGLTAAVLVATVLVVSIINASRRRS
ncbi:MAG TPA: tetratricopeptide repeat protein [Galbitalea sp.]|jgi:Flp pilus assembly protein TadD|nr:tetratricopeptide repeat protein [Galbitalea sp.]